MFDQAKVYLKRTKENQASSRELSFYFTKNIFSQEIIYVMKVGADRTSGSLSLPKSVLHLFGG